MIFTKPEKSKNPHRNQKGLIRFPEKTFSLTIFPSKLFREFMASGNFFFRPYETDVFVVHGYPRTNLSSHIFNELLEGGQISYTTSVTEVKKAKKVKAEDWIRL